MKATQNYCSGIILKTICLCVLVFTPAFTHAASLSVSSFLASAHTVSNSFFCGTLGFLTEPLGFCAESAEEGATPPQPPPSPSPQESARTATPELNPGGETPAAPTPTTSTTETPALPAHPASDCTIVVEDTARVIEPAAGCAGVTITNQYTTNPTTVIREVVRLPAQAGDTIERGGGSSATIDTSNFVTRSLFDAQVNGTLNSIDNSTDGLSDSLAESVATDLLTVTGGTTLGGSLTLAALGGGILQTNGAGQVSTTSIGATSISDDSLDFSKFVDAFTLDATATFDLDTNSADWNIDSNTFFVDSSANRVGIGTTTPSYDLTVAGDTWLNGALYDSTGNSAGSNGYVLQTTGSGTAWVATSTLGISGGASTFLGLSDTPSSFTANRIPFTNSAGDSLIDSGELTFDGNRLFVFPNGGQSDGLVAANAFIGHHSAGSTNAVFAHKDAQNNTDYALRHSSAGGTILNAADGTYGGISFAINNSVQAVLHVNGNFGIGTTTPVSKLSVTGDVTIDGLTGSTGVGSLCLTSNNEVVFNSGSDACLPSLRETKHDITPLDVNALAMVNALESVSFAYNMGDGRTRYGFIAEDVADVDALLATYDAEGTISGIDDRSMIAVVLKAVQEMWGKVQEYFARTEKLEEEVKTLEERVKALESGESGSSDDNSDTDSHSDDQSQNNANSGPVRNSESDDSVSNGEADESVTDDGSADDSDGDSEDEEATEDDASESDGVGNESSEEEESSGETDDAASDADSTGVGDGDENNESGATDVASADTKAESQSDSSASSEADSEGTETESSADSDEATEEDASTEEPTKDESESEESEPEAAEKAESTPESEPKPKTQPETGTAE